MKKEIFPSNRLKLSGLVTEREFGVGEFGEFGVSVKTLMGVRGQCKNSHNYCINPNGQTRFLETCV